MCWVGVVQTLELFSLFLYHQLLCGRVWGGQPEATRRKGGKKEGKKKK